MDTVKDAISIFQWIWSIFKVQVPQLTDIWTQGPEKYETMEFFFRNAAKVLKDLNGQYTLIYNK